MRALRSYLLRLAVVVGTVAGNPGLLRTELAYVPSPSTARANAVAGERQPAEPTGEPDGR
jgi:hypothetical protein